MPPTSSTAGDQYIVKATGTGAWASRDNQLARWNGTAWEFQLLTRGLTLRCTDRTTSAGWLASRWKSCSFAYEGPLRDGGR